MSGTDNGQQAMFSYVSPASRVPVDHPLWAVRAMTFQALRTMSANFDAISSTIGRPSMGGLFLQEPELNHNVSDFLHVRLLGEHEVLSKPFAFREGCAEGVGDHLESEPDARPDSSPAPT